jgi:hypothetical protein
VGRCSGDEFIASAQVGILPPVAGHPANALPFVLFAAGHMRSCAPIPLTRRAWHDACVCVTAMNTLNGMLDIDTSDASEQG